MPNWMLMFKTENPWGARANLFQQSKLVKQYPEGHPSRQGVCRALCMAHLGLAKTGSSLGAAIGKLKGDKAEAAEKYQGALAAFASKMQEGVQVPSGASNLFDAFKGQGKQDGMNSGLTLIEGDCRTYIWPCARDIGRSMQALANSGKYFMIVLPNHVVCGYLDAEDTMRFYDPNFGETRCPRQNFDSLLSTYLTRPVTAAAYELKTGSEIHVMVFC